MLLADSSSKLIKKTNVRNIINKRDQTLEQNKDFLNKRLEKIHERYEEDENIEKSKKRNKSQIVGKSLKHKKKNRNVLNEYKYKNRKKSTIHS